MKNTRLFLSAAVVLTVVGSALAFTSPTQFATVYCRKNPTTGACENKINFRVAEIQDPENPTDPCGNNAGGEFILSPNCIEITATTQFEEVLP